LQTGLPAVPEPISEFVLADLYAWLEAHSGFTRVLSDMPSSYSSSSSSNSSSTTSQG
jgi:hypothetical protein